MTLRMLLCLYPPWHKWKRVRWLSERSSLARCSCGRQYAMNHDVGIILPWENVEHFYNDPVMAAAMRDGDHQ